MNGVQLSQCCRATMRRQFTFNQQLARYSWYSLYRSWKDEALSPACSNPVVLNSGPLDLESSVLTTKPLHQMQI